MSTKKVVVRFAPSPTGSLHIGSLRTALFNWLWARKHEGTFILRIEDTDRERYVEGAVDNIIEALKWYGLDIDEGPIYQSQRTDLYRRYADQLVASGHAYYSFETPERLEELRTIQRLQHVPIKYDVLREGISDAEAAARIAAGDKHVVRLRIPREGTTTYTDQIYGSISVNNAEIDDQVLLKSDGFPTYHLANVVDDHEMKVTHVIRAAEWLPSTPKHIYLYQAFGWKAPLFAHVPLILGPDKAKLSKRHGAAAALEYRDQGFVPEAVINFIALLGWNPKNEEEVFTYDQLIESFDLSKINKSSAVFNIEKLEWLNGQYLRTLPIEKAFEYARPFLGEYAAQPTIQDALELARERMRRLTELPEAVALFYEAELQYDPAILIPKKESKEQTLSTLESTRVMLRAVPAGGFSVDTLKAACERHIEQHDLTNKLMLWPLRVAVTGRTASPGVFEVMAVLGKETVLKRVAAAIDGLKSL